MKVLLVVFVAFLASSITPACAREASRADRARLSVTVATFIQNERQHTAPADGTSHSFGGAKAIEIGAAVIEQRYALANWRSADGKHHGQVAFYYMCDGWNVGPVADGKALRGDQLLAMGHDAPSKAIVKKLAGELAMMEHRHIAYLKPARPSTAC